MMDATTDDEVLVAYVLDELDEAARVRFEQRLTAEPELAERLLAFERVDLVGAALRATPTAVAAPPPLLWPRRTVVAAVLLGAAALVGLAAWLFAPAPGLHCEVRAVASFGGGDLAAYAQGLGLPPDLRYVGEPRDNRPLRGVSAPQFLAAATAAEAARTLAALAAPQPPLADAFFTLRVQVDRDCDAMVWQLEPAGRWWCRFPAPDDAPVFGETAPRLTAGVHTLPRAVVAANAIGTISLHPGFAAGSAGSSPRTWIVLALRERALAGAERRAMARQAPGAAAAPADAAAVPAWATAAATDLQAWLAARGFTTHFLALQGP